MSFICNLCNNVFTRKQSLDIHLTEHRCKSPLLINFKKLNVYIGKLKKCIKDEVELPVNKSVADLPVSKLNVSYITDDDMKTLIENYDIDRSGLTTLLCDYISLIFCDPKHPENHAIKYTHKNPATYNIFKAYGINVSHGLRDSCELLLKPVLTIFKNKLKLFIKKYKNDDQDDFDWGLYCDTITLLKNVDELKMKRSISALLKSNILQPEFKYEK